MAKKLKPVLMLVPTVAGTADRWSQTSSCRSDWPGSRTGWSCAGVSQSITRGACTDNRIVSATKHEQYAIKWLAKALAEGLFIVCHAKNYYYYTLLCENYSHVWGCTPPPLTPPSCGFSPPPRSGAAHASESLPLHGTSEGASCNFTSYSVRLPASFPSQSRK